MTTATAVEAAPAREPLWRPMVEAMGKTAGASILGGLLSTLGTKLIASLLGPGSLALLQTLQQLRDGAVTAATVNGRTALVQGASALEGIERREYLRTALLLFGGGTFLVGSAMWMVPSPMVRWSRLPAEGALLLPWLAGTVVLLSVFLFLTGILNALREIGRLALLQIVAPMAAAMVAWPVALAVRAGHPLAMNLFLAIPAGATVAAAAFALKGHGFRLREWFQGPGRWWSFAAARRFFAISVAMLASGLVAAAVLLALRGSITRQEGLAMTGQFDAAWNISMNQAMLILGSVETYYLPSLAGASSAGGRRRQIGGMFLLATAAMVPVIVSLATLKPLAIRILYSQAFTATPGFLRWTLLGDFFKASAWVLATPMLATRDVGVFLALDLTAHAAFWGSATLLARIVRPSEGVAIGFMISYAVYFALCCVYARLRHGFRFGAEGAAIWLAGLALVAAASASTWEDTTVHWTRAAIWISVALLFSGGVALRMRRRGV